MTIFFLVVVLGSYLLLYKVTNATPLYLLKITYVQIQGIYPYWCWFNIVLTSSTLALALPYQLVDGGICGNDYYINMWKICYFLAVSFSIYILYFVVTCTYKPKWAGYDLVVIFISLYWFIWHVTIINIYNTVQYKLYNYDHWYSRIMSMLYLCCFFAISINKYFHLFVIFSLST